MANSFPVTATAGVGNAFPALVTGAGSPATVWTITPSADAGGPRTVSVTLSADGTPTAPDSWALVGPGEVDQSSMLSGTTTHTVTAQVAGVGPWRFEALDATPAIIATSVQTVVYHTLITTHLVDDVPFETLG